MTNNTSKKDSTMNKQIVIHYVKDIPKSEKSTGLVVVEDTMIAKRKSLGQRIVSLVYYMVNKRIIDPIKKLVSPTVSTVPVNEFTLIYKNRETKHGKFLIEILEKEKSRMVPTEPVGETPIKVLLDQKNIRVVNLHDDVEDGVPQLVKVRNRIVAITFYTQSQFQQREKLKEQVKRAPQYGKYDKDLKSQGIIYGPDAIPNRTKVIPEHYEKDKLIVDILNRKAFYYGRRIVKVIPMNVDKLYIEERIASLKAEKALLLDYIGRELQNTDEDRSHVENEHLGNYMMLKAQIIAQKRLEMKWEKEASVQRKFIDDIINGRVPSVREEVSHGPNLLTEYLLLTENGSLQIPPQMTQIDLMKAPYQKELYSNMKLALGDGSPLSDADKPIFYEIVKIQSRRFSVYENEQKDTYYGEQSILSVTLKVLRDRKRFLEEGQQQTQLQLDMIMFWEKEHNPRIEPKMIPVRSGSIPIKNGFKNYKVGKWQEHLSEEVLKRCLLEELRRSYEITEEEIYFQRLLRETLLKPIGPYQVVQQLYEYGNALVFRGLLPKDFTQLTEEEVMQYPTEEQLAYQSYRKGKPLGSSEKLSTNRLTDNRMTRIAEQERKRLREMCKKEGDEFCAGVNEQGQHVFLGISREMKYPDGTSRITQVYKKETIRKEYERSHIVTRIYPGDKRAEEFIFAHHKKVRDEQVIRRTRGPNMEAVAKHIELAVNTMLQDDRAKQMSRHLDESIINRKDTREPGSAIYALEEERYKNIQNEQVILQLNPDFSRQENFDVKIYIEENKVNTSQVLLTSMTFHKHEKAHGHEMYEMKEENKLTSDDLMQWKLYGKQKGKEVGILKPKVHFDIRVRDPRKHTLQRYADVATHVGQQGTGFMLEIGTSLPEGVERRRKEELRRYQQRKSGHEFHVVKLVSPLIGYTYNALPKHIAPTLPDGKTYEQLYRPAFMQSTANHLMNMISKEEGRKVSRIEATVMLENEMFAKLGRIALGGNMSAMSDQFIAMHARSVRLLIDPKYRKQVIRTKPYVAAEQFTPELPEGSRVEYTLISLPVKERHLPNAKPKKAQPQRYQQEPTAREIILRESLKEFEKPTLKPDLKAITTFMKKRMKDVDIYLDSRTFVELEKMLFSRNTPESDHQIGQDKFQFVSEESVRRGIDLPVVPQIHEKDASVRQQMKLYHYQNIRGSSKIGRGSGGNQNKLTRYIDRVNIMFAMDRSIIGVITGLLNVHRGLKNYHKIIVLQLIFLNSRPLEELGDLFPSYHSRREQNIKVGGTRPRTIIKPNGRQQTQTITKYRQRQQGRLSPKEREEIKEKYSEVRYEFNQDADKPFDPERIVVGESEVEYKEVIKSYRRVELSCLAERVNELDVLYNISNVTEEKKKLSIEKAIVRHYLTIMTEDVDHTEEELKVIPKEQRERENVYLKLYFNIVIRGKITNAERDFVAEAVEQQGLEPIILTNNLVEERLGVSYIEILEDQKEDHKYVDEDLQEDIPKKESSRYTLEKYKEDIHKTQHRVATYNPPIVKAFQYRNPSDQKALKKQFDTKIELARLKEFRVGIDLHRGTKSYYLDKEERLVQQLQQKNFNTLIEDGLSLGMLAGDREGQRMRGLKPYPYVYVRMFTNMVGMSVFTPSAIHHLAGSPQKRSADNRMNRVRKSLDERRVYKKYPINTQGFILTQLEELFEHQSNGERKQFKVQEEQDRDTRQQQRDRSSKMESRDRKGLQNRHTILQYFRRYRKAVSRSIKNREAIHIINEYLNYKDEESQQMMLTYYGVSKHSYDEKKYSTYLGEHQTGVTYYYSVSQLVSQIEDHHGRSPVSEKTIRRDTIKNDGKQRRVGLGGINKYSYEHDVVHVPYGIVRYHGRDTGDDAQEYSYRVYDSQKKKSFEEKQTSNEQVLDIKNYHPEIGVTSDLAMKNLYELYDEFNKNPLEEESVESSKYYEQQTNARLGMDVQTVYHKYVMQDLGVQNERSMGILVKPYTVKWIHGQGYQGGKLIPIGRRDIQDRLQDIEISKERIYEFNYYRRNLDTEGRRGMKYNHRARETSMKGMVRISVGANVVSNIIQLSQTVDRKVVGGYFSPQPTNLSQREDSQLSFNNYLIKYGDGRSKQTSNGYADVSAIQQRELGEEETLIDLAFVPPGILDDRIETRRSLYKVSSLLADGNVQNNTRHEVMFFFMVELRRTGDVYSNTLGVADPHGGQRQKGGDRFEYRMTQRQRFVQLERGIIPKDYQQGIGYTDYLLDTEEFGLGEMIAKQTQRKPRNLAKHIVHSKMQGGPYHLQGNTYKYKLLRLQELPAQQGGLIYVGEQSQAFKQQRNRMYQEIFQKKRYEFFYSYKRVGYAFRNQMVFPKYILYLRTTKEMRVQKILYREEMLSKAEYSKAMSVRNILQRFYTVAMFAVISQNKEYKAKERSARLMNGYVINEQKRQYIEREDDLPQRGQSSKKISQHQVNEEWIDIFNQVKVRTRPARLMKRVHGSKSIQKAAGFNRSNPRYGYFDGGLYNIQDRNQDMAGPQNQEVKGSRMSRTREHLGDDDKVMHVVDKRAEVIKTTRGDSGSTSQSIHSNIETMDQVRYDAGLETFEQFPVYVRTFQIKPDPSNYKVEQLYEEGLIEGTRTILKELLEGIRLAPRMQLQFENPVTNTLKKQHFDHGARQFYGQKNAYTIDQEGEPQSQQDTHSQKTDKGEEYEQKNPTCHPREERDAVKEFYDSKLMGREYNQKLDGQKQGFIVKSRKNKHKIAKYMAYMKVKTVLDAPDHMLTMNPQMNSAMGSNVINSKKVKYVRKVEEIRQKNQKQILQMDWVAATSNYKGKDHKLKHELDRLSYTKPNFSANYINDDNFRATTARMSLEFSAKQVRNAAVQTGDSELMTTYKQITKVVSDAKHNVRANRLKQDDLMMKELNRIITNESKVLSTSSSDFDSNSRLRPNQRVSPKERQRQAMKAKQNSAKNTSSGQKPGSYPYKPGSDQKK